MKCLLKACLLLISSLALHSLYGQYGVGYGPADVTYDRRGNQIMSANGFSWTYQCWVADIWYTWGSLNGQCRHSYYKDVYRIFDITPRKGILTLPDGAWTLENGACRNSDFSVVDLRNLVFLPYNDYQRYPASVSTGAFVGSHIGTLILPNSFPQYEGTTAQYDYFISEGAFEDCVIDTLYVPNCIQELKKTFAGSCKTVKTINVNEGVTGMDLRRLLSGCESVKSVTLPMGFKQIGEYGFSGLGTLETASLPDDLEEIGDYAFLNCDSLASITIPVGVTAIGRGAFNGCKNLSKICFSGDRPSVADYLTDVDKRSSLVVYVNAARNGWEDVKQNGTWLGHPIVFYREDEDWLYEERNGRVTVTRCKKPRKSMTIPGACDGVPVYAIGTDVFSASPDIVELAVSEGVEVIDTGAFADCIALSTISLPDSLREIRANAFVGCNGVREMNLPCGLEEFGSDALSVGMLAQCRTINECLVFQNWVVGHNEANVQPVLPEGVQGVGRNALSGRRAIRDAALPASVVHIASGAFANDYYLETAKLPDLVETIGQGAYSNCTELVALTFGAGVDKVGEGAFFNCISLKDVDLMSSHVRVLGPYSFAGPLQIRSVALPLSLEQVDATAFKGCQQITRVHVPTHVKPLKDLFPDSYRKIIEVVIADGEKQIVPGMFADCASLQRIVFPSSLEKVGEAAFQNCTALLELDIPDSIWSIGERAFSGCSSLQYVDLPVSLQEIASGLFEKCQSLKSLVIPAAVRRLGKNIYSGIQGRYSWECVSELSSITFLGDAPEVEEESYAGVPSSVTTFVRRGSTGWFLPGSPTLPPNGWPANHSHPIGYLSSEYSVTLDPNGADGEQTCLAFQFGEECVLPRCPFVRLGYEFTGWSKDPNGVALWQDRSHIDDLAACPGDVVVLYAIWKKNGGGEESPPIMILWRIVFDANGGECEDPVRVIEDGDLLGVLPTATRSKYKFNGWYTEVSGGIKVSTTTKVAGDATYYAQWVIDSSATCEVSFDPNGGICPESSRVVAVGKSLEAFPVCGRMGYKFDGWYTSTEGGVRVLESSSIANDVCLYAHWETINVPYELGKLYGTSESGAAETDWEAFKAYADSSHVPVVFIGGTSDCSYCRRIHDSVLGTASWNLPCLMYYDYYTTIDTRSTKEYATWFKTFDWDQGTFPFAACYWNVDGKQKIESVFTLWAYDSMEKRFLYVDGDQIRKEKIGEKILDVFASQVGRVVVRFVSDVGECREESRSILWGNTVGDLPTLQANKYVFLGWFSEREGGKRITATTKATKSMTLYAHWSFTGTSTVGCALACGCDGMGSVSGGKTAKGGAKVTLKATAKKGYVFAGWYRDAAGEEPVEGGVDYRSSSYAYVVGEDDMMFYAKFIPVAEDWVSVWCRPQDEYVRGGEIAPLEVEVNSASLATVKVTGLPTGLKFTAKPMTLKATNNRAEVDLPANTIYGTPTKSGIYTATITATTAGKKSETYKVDFVVRGDGEYLVDVMGIDGADYPDNGSDAQHAIQWGKMSGYGVFKPDKTATLKATANKGYVFAGWFSEDACVCAGGTEDDGCIYTPAAGSVDYRSTSFPVKVGYEDVLYYARFVRAEDDDMLWANVEEAYYLNGAWSLTLDIESLSLPTVTVKGLPTGLKFNSKTLTISGTPTKPGKYDIELSVKNASVKTAKKFTFKIVVPNLESDWIADGIDYAPDAYTYVAGTKIAPILPTLADGVTVKATGLPSGLKLVGGKNGVPYSIEGTSTAKPGAYTVTLTLTKGKEKETATITVNIENRKLDLVMATCDGSLTNGCKVTGSGSYAAGKKVTLKATAAAYKMATAKKPEQKATVFAGWYRNPDCTEALVGTVDYRTTSCSYVTTDRDETIYAKFVPAADDGTIGLAVNGNEVVDDSGAVRVVVKDAATLPTVVIGSVSIPKASVKGLPAGLKWDAKKNCFTGAPTKPGVYKVAFSLTNTTVKKAIVRAFTIEVPNFESPAFPGLKSASDAYPVSVGVAALPAVDAGLASTYAGYTVKVTGLPSGLSWKSGVLTGLAKKAGDYTVTFTATKGKDKQVSTITIHVEALPDWAVGTFVGMVRQVDRDESGEIIEDEDGPHDWYDILTTVSVTSAGRVSGKLHFESGTDVSFRSDSISERTDAGYIVRGQLKARGIASDVELILRKVEIATTGLGDLGAVDVLMRQTARQEGPSWIECDETSFSTDEDAPLRQNVWSSKKPPLPPSVNGVKKVVEHKDDVYTLTFGKNGSVKVSLAKADKPTKAIASGSATLSIVEYVSGEWNCELCTSVVVKKNDYGAVRIFDVTISADGTVICLPQK